MPSAGPLRSFPLYQVSRLVTELHISGVNNLRTLSPEHYERGILLIALARHGLPDWFAGNRLRRPQSLAYFTSINALAASLGRPFETVRRHVRAMVAEGTCTEDARGVAIALAPAVAERLITYLRSTHDTLLRLAEDMGTLNALQRPAVPTTRPHTRAITGVALDLMLTPFENLRDPLPDWTVMLIWGVVSAGCVRHVTVDPDWSARYARMSTPNEIRVPVTLRTVAAVTGQPYKSVWRHAKTLEKAGAITAKADGYIVDNAYLGHPAVAERVISSAEYCYRRLSELVREGLDPSMTMPYLDGRPPLMTITAK